MRKEKPLNPYDTQYKQDREVYGTLTWALKKLFFRVRACNNLRNSFGWEVFEEKENLTYTQFKAVYTQMCDAHARLERYWDEYHDQMDVCKTWNETLIHPDEFMIKWEMEGSK